ncbi:Kelch repeat-containing protein [Phaeocystidibacter marisrubri]|uniref:T9SS type A sorting domain-containing protein n=1 Tax=Phaeocystidibacter marisrubri TaxID=1577780 RepID=A0A6L3ZIZ8_9FLAO|nr:kelch repeat-containing protein [Phaeocystidibacter marisrubri]KAB2817140.1 hypothetical protein F8C82_01720 [Phaeocystidibacter marisrubri]GGH76694.1 hypothetical protein GCM10011318_25340 [Phaeocystidibacter marisrubri]
MKPTLSTALLLTLSFASFGQWTELNLFPGTLRDDGLVLQGHHDVYVGTGIDASYNNLNSFQHFSDAASQPNWLPGVAMPNGAERQAAIGVSDSIHGYVFGGLTQGVSRNDLWEFNYSNQIWSPLANLPDSGRYGAAGFLLKGHVYVVSGDESGSASCSEIWKYSIANNTWSLYGQTPFGSRWRSAYITSDSLGYLFGGVDSTGAYRPELYSFSPSHGWTEIGQHPAGGLAFSAMVAIDDRLYIFGGSDASGQYSNELWYFNTQELTWHSETPLPDHGLREVMAWTLNKAFYLTFGLRSDGTRSAKTWRFLPSFSATEVARKEIQLSPTLANSEIFIQHPAPILDTVQLISENGIILQTYTRYPINQKIDVSELANGVYQVRILHHGVTEMLRFVKI